jgi:putative sterol carrier protein
MAAPKQVMAEFMNRFQPDAAEGMEAVYQLSLTGEEGGIWHLTIADQKCRLSEGPAAKSDVSITMSAQDWGELIAGRLDGFSAYLSGRIQLDGNFALVMQLQPLFGL